jgi:hypothetical protein
MSENNTDLRLKELLQESEKRNKEFMKKELKQQSKVINKKSKKSIFFRVLLFPFKIFLFIFKEILMLLRAILHKILFMIIVSMLIGFLIHEYFGVEVKFLNPQTLIKKVNTTDFSSFNIQNFIESIKSFFIDILTKAQESVQNKVTQGISKNLTSGDEKEVLKMMNDAMGNVSEIKR